MEMVQYTLENAFFPAHLFDAAACPTVPAAPRPKDSWNQYVCNLSTE
jgi:hypothetical protein